jgi:glucans biosynthesis protein
MTNDPLHHASGEPARLREARRCGAKTRSGKPCRSPAVHGRPRCRMHGCGRGSGGPLGERNGNYRHGRHTKERMALREVVRQLVREAKALTRNALQRHR